MLVTTSAQIVKPAHTPFVGAATCGQRVQYTTAANSAGTSVMFSIAPNPAEVATMAATACLPRRINTPLSARPHITTDPLPQTTVWVPVTVDGAELPTAGAVLVLTEPDHDVTVGGTAVYKLTNAATAVAGISARLATSADRIVWSQHFEDPQATPRAPTPEPVANSGRFVCVATGHHSTQHGLVWLKLVIAGMVRTRIAINGPPGTRVNVHGARWTKITHSGDVTTAVFRAL